MNRAGTQLKTVTSNSTVSRSVIWKSAVFSKIIRWLLGRQGNDGFIFKTVVYVLLISVGFVYLYPVLYMLSSSMKNLSDLLDPSVNWIPTHIDFQNFVKAWQVLDYPKALLDSIIVSVLPALLQTISASLVGYGFAKFKFPGKWILLGLLLFTFIVPAHVVMIPLYIMFNKYGMVGTPLPFIVPAIFASGIRGSLFILIYIQFFRSVPDALEEAAQIDGAGYLRTFFRIVAPISMPAFVVVFLFTFVWQWNETTMASLYLGDSMTTLLLQLQGFANTFLSMYSSASSASGGGQSINEAIEMAGTLLSVLPMLILYFVAQRWFVEVADRTGIAGE